MNHHEEMPDPQKIKEILDVAAEKIPGLLKTLSELLYGAQSAKQYAAAAATFYKELKAAGMTEEQAFELTQQYMSTLNLGNLMGKAIKHDHD
ncbi:MAG: hypothetical protein BV459_07545 [Thermoplasmata archaeon M11B2D]|nr:MAG: hypothetical protein BV459_07545 [Thermoplasmata archaeon M11B2D]